MKTYTKQELEKIASAFNNVLLSFLITYIFGVVYLYMAAKMIINPTNILIIFILLFCSELYFIVSVCLYSTARKNMIITTIFYVLCVFLPLISLILLLCISRSVSALFRKADISMGILGVNVAQVAALPEEFTVSN